MQAPRIEGFLRDFMLHVPEEINTCSGIWLKGRLIKSIVFSTDVSIICNSNADAVLAVYPFTPQPIISQAIINVAGKPVFVGVGGGLTKGPRVVHLALSAEDQGAAAVVVNAPTGNEVIKILKAEIDVPIITTVLSDNEDLEARIVAGVNIFNVSAAAATPRVVEAIRQKHPEFPIIATGGPTKESILETIEAGANAITWTPPSNGEVFHDIMDRYRKGLPHP